MKTKLNLFVAIASLVTGQLVFAGSATWNSSPATGDWNTTTNWTPNTVPNGPRDSATFGVSSISDISISAATEVNSIIFSPGASAYTITNSVNIFLTISGAGVINNSGVTENFVPTSDDHGTAIFFSNSATAGGSDVIYTLNPPAIYANFIYFNDSSTAGSATFIDHGTSLITSSVQFSDSSSVGAAKLICDAGPTGDNKVGEIDLFDSATGGTANIFLGGSSGATYNSGGGLLRVEGSADLENATVTVNGSLGTDTVYGQAAATFTGSSTANNTTLTATGGAGDSPGALIAFSDKSSGETCTITLSGNAQLYVVDRNVHNTLTIGSLEGEGIVNLGSTIMGVGSNGKSTVLSGVVQDGDLFSGGVLTKLGQGTLTLSGSNLHTGGTTVSAGTLIVANTAGSATGLGTVTVKGGILGGKGIIGGTVTVGTGSGSGAFLAPAAGSSKQKTLSLQSTLTLQADATYIYTFSAKRTKALTDLVIANGVTINGATFNLSGQTQSRMRRGLTLTVMNNTSANPISGAFSNLPDGATVTVNGNNLQANYEGGDGNDLTLTVVP